MPKNPLLSCHEEYKTLLARNSLYGFILATMPSYQAGWVHEEICRELDEFLQAVIEGKRPRLMLTLPPRHGKSEIASRRFPAYVLGRYPKMSIIATSYSADLSTRMSRDVQRIMMSDEYAALFPDVAFSQKRDGAQRRADYFENGLGGSYRSAGVGGGITGMGGDIILIDDPFKDRASADSATIRQSIWDWYTSTLYTRLSPNGGIIVINTRWHMDDLSGRLLEAETRGEGDKWRVVNFPAIAEADEKHRKQGEALHPDRYPLDQLQSIKKAVGTRDWEALYQQHPVPDGGAIFKQEWFRTYTRLPDKMDSFVMSWDMTFKEGAQSDFVVGQVWGRKGADFYLIDQVRGQWGFTETLAQFRLLSKKYPEARRKLVEDKANGPAVIETLKHEIPGIVPVEPDGSKTARAFAVTAIFEAGNVYIPDSSIMPWIKEFVTEMLQFPSGAHDDVVDSCVQAIRFFDRSKGLSLSSKLTRRLNARF